MVGISYVTHLMKENHDYLSVSLRLVVNVFYIMRSFKGFFKRLFKLKNSSSPVLGSAHEPALRYEDLLLPKLS